MREWPFHRIVTEITGIEQRTPERWQARVEKAIRFVCTSDRNFELMMLWGEGWTQKEIAIRFGVSMTRVQQIIRRNLFKLRARRPFGSRHGGRNKYIAILAANAALLGSIPHRLTEHDSPTADADPHASRFENFTLR